MCYFFSPALETFKRLALARVRAGRGAVLLLQGIPGGGKTSFAEALAAELGGHYYYYSCTADSGRSLLYEINVQGVLDREHAWAPGPAWEAFLSSRSEFAVLLIDEVDKAGPEFDAFLLRLLQEFRFRGPAGETIAADPSQLVVVLTSNGRRKLPGEVLRRAQRVDVPFPEGPRLRMIIGSLLGEARPSSSLVELVIRLGDEIRAADAENAPSPQELAGAIFDLHTLCGEEEVHDLELVRAVAASWMIKEGGADAISKIVKWNWAKALLVEAQRKE